MRTRAALSAIALLIVFVNGQKIDTPIPCGQTSDCRDIKTLPRNALCKDGYCMCPNEAKNCSSVNASVHKIRIPGPLVYRKCKIDQDCIFEGGFCNHVIKQCDCVKGYVPSRNKQHCVAALVSIDANCTDENQCLSVLANSTCQDKKCVCAPDYYYINDTCWKKIEYGYACTSDQDCSHVEDAICTNDRKCGCETETVLNANGTKCLDVAKKMQDECEEIVQCTMTFNNSACVDNLCQCEANYHYEDDTETCYLNRGLDDECANDYDCYQAEDYYANNRSTKSLKCEDNRCTCADYFVRSNETCDSSGSPLAASLSVISSAMALLYGFILAEYIG